MNKKKVDLKNKSFVVDNKNEKYQNKSESEPYKVPPDYIWKANVNHEKVLKKAWLKSWGNIYTSDNNISSTKKSTTDVLLPRSDYNQLYSTSGPDPKICFVREQYGYYRKAKYLQKSKETITAKNLPIAIPKLRHFVNPLLC